jgi:hypothetical protein
MKDTMQPFAGDTKNSMVVVCITVTVISCILAAGIIIARFPGPAPLWGSIMWIGIAFGLTLISMVLILRRKPFAREVFFKVAKWVFLYMLVLSGIGEYVLVFDGTRGEPLVIMTIILVLFLINVPMLWGYSVARHEPASDQS